jgi:protein-tyrosine phosphatase
VSRAVLDLSAHILPGVHAATGDLPASLAAVRTLVASGVTHAVAPALVGASPDDDMAVADAARARLSTALGDADLPLELLPGAVVPFDLLPSLTPDQIARATVGGAGRWLMITLPDAGWPLRLPDLMRALDMAGLGVVIAHPEWAQSVQLAPDRLRDVLGRGALVQMSAGSLTGAHGPRAERTAFHLLRNGMVTVVASDAPSKTEHFLALHETAETLEKVLRRPADEIAWMLDTGPRLIAAGDAVRAPRLVPQPREARQA